MSWTRTKKLLLAIAGAGIPVALTASCDPYDGSLSLFRADDHHHSGLLDVLFGDVYYDDCFLNDCYYDDDYYYEEIVFFD